MKKLWDWLTGDVAPMLMGLLITLLVVTTSLGALIWSVKWVLGLVGVM